RLANGAERLFALGENLGRGRNRARLIGLRQGRVRLRCESGLRCGGHQSLPVGLAASTPFPPRAEGVNRTTPLSEIRASSPVFGLRPTRAFFRRTTKLPKRANFTSSSRSSSEHTISSTRSRKLLESCFVRPTF